MSAPTLLHVHIGGIIPFKQAQILQSALVNRYQAYKAASSSASPSSTSSRREPYPTVLTFTPKPVYTFGRRDPYELIPPDLISSLLEGRLVRKDRYQTAFEIPEIAPTLRGGQTTFHGPGSLLIYPIFDLKSPYIRDPQYRPSKTRSLKPNERDVGTAIHPDGLDVRAYVKILESTTIDLLKPWSITGFRTKNPGVWVGHKDFSNDTVIDPAELRKIAAVGLHLRRNITSFGTALNVHTDLGWFDRITACGLEGLGTTSMRSVHAIKAQRRMAMSSRPKRSMDHWTHTEDWLKLLGGSWIRMLANHWVEIFASRLWGAAHSPQIYKSVRIQDLELDLDNLKDGGFWKAYAKGQARKPVERMV
ncbi:uncharacterized protein BP5553_06732 [Venustampulla echinocandica]|uniref:BPL/LPL catalytic domain-containing protein n=1 Tax=Venustampulla echinocandica TaxID=2656787 RepID=A0A370TKR4_9HELO|nr:uncharacterized protein BP5553_06732 [Venustampulla echinocandica]RDL36120.1 hypothetical protein BP5553_06732 [Venustampulla echinocandica]